jgi:hypothetical protein
VLGGDWGTLQGPTPSSPRGGALARVEGDRWIATLFGVLGDHPPTDPDGFQRFADSLLFPDLGRALRRGVPLDDPVAFRFPASSRVRYEQLRRFPTGLLPIGDAVCSLNPIYGQGMTVAASQALALRDALHRGTPPDPRRWLRRVGRIADAPWDMVVGGDLALPEVEGPRSAKVRVLGAYLSRLHRAASDDATLAVAFARVMALVDAPPSPLHPRVVARVLRGGSRRQGHAGAPRAAVRTGSARLGAAARQEVDR